MGKGDPLARVIAYHIKDDLHSINMTRNDFAEIVIIEKMLKCAGARCQT